MCYEATRRYPTLLKIGKFLAPSIPCTDTAYFYLSPFAAPRLTIVMGRDVTMGGRALDGAPYGKIAWIF